MNCGILKNFLAVSAAFLSVNCACAQEASEFHQESSQKVSSENTFYDNESGWIVSVDNVTKDLTLEQCSLSQEIQTETGLVVSVDNTTKDLILVEPCSLSQVPKNGLFVAADSTTNNLTLIEPFLLSQELHIDP